MTAAIETVEALDEYRAKEIYRQRMGRYPGDDFTGMRRDSFINQAKAIREADERAGLVVVPREPTQAMAEAYERHCGWVLGLHSWGAAVSASPLSSAAQGEGGE